jgi:sec-independent protein translocase protein TatA
MIVLALSGGHIIILVAALLLFFGGSKIPELMGGLGKGMKDFKKAIKDDDVTSTESPKETPIEAKADNKREPLKE